MNTGAPSKLITYEDSLSMPENKLEEIVHGESRIMPPPTFYHALLLRRMSELLQAQMDPPAYKLFGGDVGLGIERTPLTCRIPDLMVYRAEALWQGRARVAADDPYVWTPPDLLVECLSPANRKGAVRELLADYEKVAVPEVWLLDPALPRYTSYRFESGSLKEWQAKQRGEVTLRMLSNITVDLGELWAAFAGQR